jgi:hypothetical protein
LFGAAANGAHQKGTNCHTDCDANQQLPDHKTNKREHNDYG